MNLDAVNAVDDHIDVVYNLAGFSELNKAHLDPKKTINLNVIGNMNVLNVCRKKSSALFMLRVPMQ